MKIKTLKDLRKTLKPLGYSFKTQKISWGKHITYTHIESGDSLTYSIFTPETLERWNALFTWLREHKEEISFIQENEDPMGKIYGLTK